MATVVFNCVPASKYRIVGLICVAKFSCFEEYMYLASSVLFRSGVYDVNHTYFVCLIFVFEAWRMKNDSLVGRSELTIPVVEMFVQK